MFVPCMFVPRGLDPTKTGKVQLPDGAWGQKLKESALLQTTTHKMRWRIRCDGKGCYWLTNVFHSERTGIGIGGHTVKIRGGSTNKRMGIKMASTDKHTQSKERQTRSAEQHICQGWGGGNDRLEAAW